MEFFMEKDLTTGKITPQLIGFTIPLVLGNLFQLTYNAVDSIIVGRYVGKEALAAVGICNPISTLFILFLNGLCMGASILMGNQFGAKDYDRLHRQISTTMLSGIAFSLILSVLCIVFARPILLLMQVDASIMGMTINYLRIIFAGLLFTFMYNCFASTLRALGDSQSPLLFVLVACIVNVIGDLALVAGLHMDAAGAAIATVSAQALSVIFAILLLIKKKLPFTITLYDFRFNTQCPKFLSIGLPLALQEFLTQLSFLALCAFVNRLGLEASSGYGVACKIVNFAMLVPSALMQSMASFVSQNVGAGKVKRAKHTLFTGIGVGLCVGCIVFTLVLLKGDILSDFFSTDAAVIQNSYDYLKGFALESIVTAVLFSMIGYFNGNNQTLWVMTQGLIQTLLVRLPLAYFMSIQPDASLTKIGLAAPVSTIVGIVLNIGYYIYWTRKQQHPPVEEII